MKGICTYVPTGCPGCTRGTPSCKSGACACGTLGLLCNWISQTEKVGNAWLAGGASLGLWVPSYVEKRERNILSTRTTLSTRAM
ncbi:MAG: hypothetical protein ACRENE_24395 [Polyangiaceae bacterium]